MSSLLPNGKQHFDDNNGNPLVGGKVYFYIPNTSTLKDTYQDKDLTILNTNPVILDARGEATIWGYGTFRQVLQDQFGNLIWDKIVQDPTSVAQQITDQLRADLATSGGAAMIGYGTPKRTVSKQLDLLAYGSLNVNDPAFAGGADPTGATDSTLAFQAAIDASVALGQGYQTTNGTIVGGYVSVCPMIHAAPGTYKISNQLTCPSYLRLYMPNVVIYQTDSTKPILNGANAYQWDIEGIHFAGGAEQVNLQNNNVDVTIWNFTDCTFSVSSTYAVRTFPTGGVTSHLSANLAFFNCRFYKPKQVLLNYCDSARFVNCWVFMHRSNFADSTAAFVNGSATTDGYPTLYLDGMFGVPDLTDGGPRPTNARWIDNNAGAVIANESRFGGESGGMTVVYHSAAPHTTTPFTGSAVELMNCDTFGGPSSLATSAVVALVGQVPSRIKISGNKGPVDCPYIINLGGSIPNFATYFSGFEAASGLKAYDYFKVSIPNDNDSIGAGSVPIPQMIPDGLRLYLNNFRETSMRRAAPQAILAGGSTAVAFDTTDYDTQGGTQGTTFRMPVKATKLRVTVNITFDGAFGGGVLAAEIKDTGTTSWGKTSINGSSNPNGQSYSLSAVVNAPGGTVLQAVVTTGAGVSPNITSCRLVTEALDYLN